MKNEIFKEITGVEKSEVDRVYMPYCACLCSGSDRENNVVLNYKELDDTKCKGWCCSKVKGYGYRIGLFTMLTLEKSNYEAC